MSGLLCRWQSLLMLLWVLLSTPPPVGGDHDPGRDATQHVFEKIYASHAWGSKGNGSGGGSTKKRTYLLRAHLKWLLKAYNIQSILDLPCGGMAWMGSFLQEMRREEGFHELRYKGVDIARKVVAANSKRFKGVKNTSFGVVDISHDEVPTGYDLVFTRDTLMHLPLKLAYSYLEAVKKSGNKWLLIGTYNPIRPNQNTNIQVGNFYPINLLQHPFRLRPLRDNFGEGADHKSMHLFNISEMEWDPLPENYLELYENPWPGSVRKLSPKKGKGKKKGRRR